MRILSKLWEYTRLCKLPFTSKFMLYTPNLISPVGGVFSVNPTVTLTWSPVNKATGYDWQCATDSGFTNIINSGHTTSTSVDVSVTEDGYIYWRVRATKGSIKSSWASDYFELFNFRYCLSYDGVNDYCDINHHSAFSLNDGSGGKPMSWSFWAVYNSVSGVQNPVQKGETMSTREYQLLLDNNRLYAIIYDTSGNQAGRATNAGIFTVGEKYHIVATYNGGNIVTGTKIYINGNRADTTNYGSSGLPPKVGAQKLFIGTGLVSSGWRYHNGKIDDIGIFNKELSASEINYLYNSGQGRDARLVTGCVGYWKCNENTGMTVNDATGNGRNMTLANNPSTPSWTTW